MFAIVDIETTGGSPANGGITEIAVLLHNGEKVTDSYSWLINPEMHIPAYITALTGIHNAMVADAPVFAQIAPALMELLSDKIFVAHNVNFDHSFLHHHFGKCDLHFQPRKLCTVRYARKVMPGHPSYSLGNLCRSLGIPVENRHRAKGDADATARLLGMLLSMDKEGKVLQEMTKGRNPHSYLPMHVPVEMIERLPYGPGVYYFKDKAGKVVYVGKAVNLKYRVKSHFTHNGAGRRRQEMLRNIYSIDYTCCATELMAIVLESAEIKRLWPLYNRSQKSYEAVYGLYAIENLAGRVHLLVEKKKRTLPALHTFARTDEALALVGRAAAQYELTTAWAFGRVKEADTLPDDFNDRMRKLIAEIGCSLPDFALVQKGEDSLGRPLYVVFLIVHGAFKGMGTTPHLPETWDDLPNIIEQHAENDFIRSSIYAAVARREGFIISPEIKNS